MQRKLIKQGGGGFTIYLPKKWIDKKGLSSGDVIDITEIETSLVINSQRKEKKEISVQITDKNQHDIYPLLTHFYRLGFNKIKITGISDEILNRIQKVVTEILLGFEVTERDTHSCTIENISEPTDEKFDVILRRVFLIIQETIEYTAIDVASCSYTHWEEIKEMRKQQDKFIFFSKRLLIKEVYNKKLIVFWDLLTYLTLIEHSLFYLYKHAEKNKIKGDKAMDEILNSLKEYFTHYYNAYYKKNVHDIHYINKERPHFGKIIELIEKSKGKETVMYAYLKESFRLIQMATSPILALILEY